MESHLILQISSEPLMLVIRCLLCSAKPRHLREISRRCAISPAGVSDILRRLKKCGALKMVRNANRKCYSLRLPADEDRCLRDFFTAQQHIQLKSRAKRFSAYAQERFLWIDEAQEYSKHIKTLPKLKAVR